MTSDGEKPDKPDPAGYTVTARILRFTTPHGTWRAATWDCPYCEDHFEFHGAGPDAEAVAVAAAVLDTLDSGAQLQIPCPCGAKQYIGRELVAVPNIVKIGNNGG